ncbi:MAG: Spy/CpxP family protein refolding chaperone [Candidatus Acidiferrales bacterium]
MKRLVAIATALALLTMAPLLPGKTVPVSNSSGEQCPPPPAVVASFLGFTPSQTAQFLTLLTEFQTTVQGLQAQIAPLQVQLDGLLSQPHPDPVLVGKLVVEIHALEEQVGHAIQSYQELFAGLLTQEQQQKVQGVTQASQLQPVVGAFVTLYLVPPPPSPPCQKQ